MVNDMEGAREREVIAVLARRSGTPASMINRETRFVEDLKLDADDAIDAIIEVCDKLSIRKKGFRAELYFSSEPSLLSIFRRTSKTSKLPYTVGHLVDAASRGELTG